MTTDAPSSDTLAPNSRAILADLYVQLPKSADEPEAAIAARARKGLDAVIALRPDDAFEARLATRIVAMDAHAADALAAASLAAGDPDKLRQCRAQAASMARQSDSALRTLRRMQAERDKAYNAMHPAAMERAGYWFKEAAAPAPARAPVPAPSPEPDPRPRSAPAGAAEPVRTPAVIDADAKLYEALYPQRVTRICAAGGLPPDLDFGPPEPEIVEALLRRAGVSPRATRLNGTGR